MNKKTTDVIGFGNAIVDVIARCDEAFLVERKLAKGSMHLIGQEDASALYSAMGPGVEMSGGSAANTIAGIAGLGGVASFAGKVAGDTLGNVFAHDIRALGVRFETTPLEGGEETGRCLVLVTPDGERTMNTYLGAAQYLGPDDVDPQAIADAKTVYLEGYLWDPPAAKDAFRKAARIAGESGGKVALSLSDPFCVERFRSEFLELMRSGDVNLVFANEHEVRALYETSDTATAMQALGKDVSSAVVTLGADGACVLTGDDARAVPAKPANDIVDLTGAGDLFAAGFLFGDACDMPWDDCARLGALCASEVISHMGARPQHDLKALARQNGFEL